MTAVLSARGVSVNFGGVRALVDVDLDVGEGQLVGLIGPNGAGKTTFIDAISGIVRSRGRVELDGRDLTSLPPHARARLGLTRTWQSIELFDDLTVLENLTVLAPRQASTSAEELLGQFGLEQLGGAMPSEISQAQRKVVGLARALAAEPRVLCLDEPAAGLDVTESEALGRPAARDRGRRHGDAPRRSRHGARARHLGPRRRARVREGDRRRDA